MSRAPQQAAVGEVHSVYEYRIRHEFLLYKY